MRILLIEDDLSLQRAILYRLTKEGMQAEAQADGLAGLEALRAGAYDLVLLDRMLPGLDGVSLLRRARAEGDATPVLMLTAMDGIEDRVTGLDAGADDYLLKPFAMEEMMARIRALSRRPPQWAPQNLVEAGELSLDTERWALRCGACEVPLSRREGQLMAFLLRNRGQVLPRAVLLDRVWADAMVEEGNLDIYIHFLRKRLRELGAHADIRTVRGVGYQLRLEGGQ